MLHPEPDSSTIDAWLAGTLSPGEIETLEGWLEDNPEFLEEELVELDPIESLPPPTRRDLDPNLTALIDRISGEAVPLLPRLDKEAWKEVLTPGEDPDSPGSIGPYEIIELIAVAGMGIVFKARDPELDRLAALKVLSPDLASNATARERFLREARAAASLEHENILPIYGVHDEAIPFFAMRYAPGGTLQERLDAKNLLEIDEIKSIGLQVAAALQAAHEKGIVHRDIKPANILFDENGSGIWVCDFGIARCAEDPSITYPGAIAGTPQFMSPEQAAGKPVDGRSDLYSLGAVLYQCAYGRSLHSGETTVSVLRKLTDEGETQPDTRGRTLPRFLRRLISSLLSHDPADRPASAQLVVDAFEKETAPSPKRHVRSRRKWIAALLATALAFGLLQVPAVRKAVNHSLALRKPQSFSIDGRLGIYSRLDSAVESAKPGETIRLSSVSPVEVDNLRIPADKPLHFAPSRSGKPVVLTTGIPGAPGIISESELILSDLVFQINPKRDGDGILIMQGANLSLENCEFHFAPKRPIHFGDYTPRTVDLRNGVDARITDCRFDVPLLSAITFRGRGNRLQLQRSSVRAHYGVDVISYADPENETLLAIHDSSFSGTVFLRGPVNPGSGQVRVTGDNNEFRPTDAVVWFQGTHPGTLPDVLEWRTENDRFPDGRAHILVSPAGSEGGRIPLSLLPQMEKGTVKLERTGEIYTSLQEAIDAAEPGDALELSGWFFAGTPEIRINGKDNLHLRSAPGSVATIVSLLGSHHAVFSFCPIRISGLHFYRFHTPLNSLPLLGIIAPTGSVIVEDCIFESFLQTDLNQTSGVGMALTNVSDALVQRCLFRNGTAVYLVGQSETEQENQIQIRDCLSLSWSFLMARWREGQNPMKVSISRSVIKGDFFLSNFPSQEFHPLGLKISNCIVDVESTLVAMKNTGPESVYENLQWVGRNNHYRASVPGLVSISSEDSFTNPIPILPSLEELMQKLTASSEEGSSYGIPFRPLPGDSRILVEDLLSKLEDASGSPAAEILEHPFPGQ